ncbi:MAG TPA: hypothetical protein VFN76_11360 [Candidatus Limnocylindria bacterium]|nr:hypothetical protein [Candidatus Limnocylindria bacterium]
MNTATQSQIQNRISEFVKELDLLVRRSALEALQGVLSNGSSPARRGRPAGAKRAPGRPRGRQPADLGDASAKIVDFVRANDGQGIGAISAATGVALPVAKKAASRLLAEGQLKKSGEKRGTVYHVGSGRAPATGGATKAKTGKKRGRRAAKKAKAA